MPVITGKVAGTGTGPGNPAEYKAIEVDANGAAHTIDGVWQVPAAEETFLLNCNADADGITDETAPASAELWELTVPDDCTGMEVELDWSPEGGVPYARGFIFAVGVADELAAIEALATPDNTPGSAYSTGKEGRVYVGLNTVKGVSWAKGTVATVWAGALLNAGTGATAVRAEVKFRRDVA